VVEYIPLKEGIEGNEFNLRVQFYHYGTNQARLIGGFIDWEQTSGPIELRENAQDTRG